MGARSSERGCRLFRVWRSRNDTCAPHATVVTRRLARAAVLGCAVAIGGATPAFGRVATVAQSTAQPTAAAPSTESAVLAWTTARAWLDALVLPPEDDPRAVVELPDVRAVSVLLRRGGNVVGRGEWTEGGPLGVRRAMARALGDLYGDPDLRRLLESSPEAIAPRLTLEIECAGEPVPVLGRTFEEVGSRIQPGIDGVALRRGTRWAFAFPGRMLSANTARSPGSSLAAMAVELGLAALDLPELRRTEQVEVYRLPTRRLVQLVPGATPVEPLRSDELVAIESVTAASVRALAERMAQRMAEHVLLTGLDAGGAGALPTMLRGDYHPVADEYRPLEATPFDQWLVAYALLRHINAPGMNRSSADRIQTAVHEWLLHRSAGVCDDNGVPVFASDREAAMAILACLEISDRPAPIDAVLAAALKRLQAAGDRASAHGLQAALVAAALARAAQAGVPGASDADASAAVEQAWARTPAREHGSMLPWIVMAEQGSGSAATAPGLGRLTALRDALLSAQSGAASGSPLDLRGGFPLAGQPELATARSLPALAGLAVLLELPESNPQRGAEIWAGQLAALRFVMQLVVRPPFDQLYRNPERAAWGLREAPWDCDQATAAQALGLFVLLESLRHWPAAAAPNGS